MKFLFSILTLFLISNIKANDSDFLKKLELVFKEAKLYKLENIGEIKTKISSDKFDVVQLIDNRFDILYSGVYFNAKSKLFWVDGISKLFLDSLFLTTSDNDTTKYKIILVVNDLWFFDSQTGNKDKLNITLKKGDIGYIKLGIKLHTYIQKNGLVYPLSIIDTNFREKNRINFGIINLKELFTNAMLFIRENIEKKLAQNKFTFRSPLTINEITNRYKNTESVNQEEQKQPKGVYNTYTDFINKTPLNDSFLIEFDKKRFHHLYIKEDKGVEYLSRNTWGVFDGKQLWINDNGFLFPLLKISKTYYWLGVDINETKCSYSIPITNNFNNNIYGQINASVNTYNIDFHNSVFRLHPSNGKKIY